MEKSQEEIELLNRSGLRFEDFEYRETHFVHLKLMRGDTYKSEAILDNEDIDDLIDWLTKWKEKYGNK